MKKPGYIDVFLRIHVGMLTRKIQIPRSCLDYFRVPFKSDLKMATIADVQDLMGASVKFKLLIFKWDGMSNQAGLPILDLIDVQT